MTVFYIDAHIHVHTCTSDLLSGLRCFAAHNLAKEAGLLALCFRIRKVPEVVPGKILALLTRDVDDAVGTLAELLRGLGIGEWEVDNDAVAWSPIGRRSNGMLACELAGVDGSQDLVEVAATRRRVRHHQGNRLVGLDDEDGAHGQRKTSRVAVARIKDADGRGMIAIGIAEERERYIGASGGLDVLDPRAMGVGIVAGESADLDTALLELRSKTGGGGELCRANRSEISRMHEHKPPVAIEVLVEIELVGVLGGSQEIGELNESTCKGRACECGEVNTDAKVGTNMTRPTQLNAIFVAYVSRVLRILPIAITRACAIANCYTYNQCMRMREANRTTWSYLVVDGEAGHGC